MPARAKAPAAAAKARSVTLWTWGAGKDAAAAVLSLITAKMGKEPEFANVEQSATAKETEQDAPEGQQKDGARRIRNFHAIKRSLTSK